MTSVFGFSTQPGTGGEYIPILKYDARAGRFFRIDRVDSGQGFVPEPIDITETFKAIFDFENIEVGWLHLMPGVAPDMQLVPMGATMPEKPSPLHKNGLRFLLKLAKDCGGDKPIREIAGTSKAFLSGVEAAYHAYLAGKDANPGKLPVFTVEKITPVKTGSGAKSSTNYYPTFTLVGWSDRGDLVPTPRPTPMPASPFVTAPPRSNGATPPATGSAPPPPRLAPASAPRLEDDFG